MPEYQWMFDVANKLSGTFVLLAIIYGGFKKWWVFGHHYADKEREANEWKTLALSGRDLTKQAVHLATTVVQQ